ncbi:hypothetical protein CO046_01735 [Candidatus Peregrinibacteria bacterium CG_4_9_14_0_2_um_filter_53_11]|nr:MAG: hypothetical protein CO046_01735 [Candidatus Peregrinibacteria bacterium CG_4_9_14_0_2_um_filter_53_11]
MNQIVEESKSIFRIEQCYKKDCLEDKELKSFWDGLRIYKEEQIAQLLEHLKEELSAKDPAKKVPVGQ